MYSISYFGVKLHFQCRWHTRVWWCFFLSENSAKGIIILAQDWDASFQESLRLTMTQIPAFENFGLITTKNDISLSLCFSILPFYFQQNSMQTEYTQCFPLNKPHVSSQKIQCVISGGRREAQEKRGKVKCTQRYWRVTKREERGVESCGIVRHD